MILWILYLFIVFILIAEYSVLSNRQSQKEHWSDYKAIVKDGRLTQNIARVIPMYNIALDPIEPQNKHFSWIKFFDGSGYKQTPFNIAFVNLH